MGNVVNCVVSYTDICLSVYEQWKCRATRATSVNCTLLVLTVLYYMLPQSISFHSIPFHFIPFHMSGVRDYHSIDFIPFHFIPFHFILFHLLILLAYFCVFQLWAVSHLNLLVTLAITPPPLEGSGSLPVGRAKGNTHAPLGCETTALPVGRVPEQVHSPFRRNGSSVFFLFVSEDPNPRRNNEHRQLLVATSGVISRDRNDQRSDRIPTNLYSLCIRKIEDRRVLHWTRNQKRARASGGWAKDRNRIRGKSP